MLFPLLNFTMKSNKILLLHATFVADLRLKKCINYPIYYSQRMKNTCILAVFVTIAAFSFSQNGSRTKQVSIQSNGVVVHQSAGNEGFVEPVYTQSEVRTLEDWTLPECIDALHAIDEKMALLGTSEEDRAQLAQYQAQRVLVEQRRNALISQTH